MYGKSQLLRVDYRTGEVLPAARETPPSTPLAARSAAGSQGHGACRVARSVVKGSMFLRWRRSGSATFCPPSFLARGSRSWAKSLCRRAITRSPVRPTPAHCTTGRKPPSHWGCSHAISVGPTPLRGRGQLAPVPLLFLIVIIKRIFLSAAADVEGEPRAAVRQDDACAQRVVSLPVRGVGHDGSGRDSPHDRRLARRARVGPCGDRVGGAAVVPARRGRRRGGFHAVLALHFTQLVVVIINAAHGRYHAIRLSLVRCARCCGRSTGASCASACASTSSRRSTARHDPPRPAPTRPAPPRPADATSTRRNATLRRVARTPATARCWRGHDARVPRPSRTRCGRTCGRPRPSCASTPRGWFRSLS